MDQLLGGLFGGQDDDDRRRTRAKDFVSRFETGSPYEGYDADEAVQNYRNVADRLSPAEYEDAAEAFQRLSPQDRNELAQLMQQRGGGQFGNVQGDDPRDLARMTSRFRQQDQGGLMSLFGMGGGGGGGDLLGAARGDRGGGGGGGLGDLMGNPLAKAALGGIAAMALKKMMR